jgi:hypothetical protein
VGLLVYLLTLLLICFSMVHICFYSDYHPLNLFFFFEVFMIKKKLLISNDVKLSICPFSTLRSQKVSLSYFFLFEKDIKLIIFKCFC